MLSRAEHPAKLDIGGFGPQTNTTGCTTQTTVDIHLWHYSEFMRGDCQEKETAEDFCYTYRRISGAIYLLVAFYERTAPYWTARKGTQSCTVLYNRGFANTL